MVVPRVHQPPTTITRILPFEEARAARLLQPIDNPTGVGAIRLNELDLQDDSQPGTSGIQQQQESVQQMQMQQPSMQQDEPPNNAVGTSNVNDSRPDERTTQTVDGPSIRGRIRNLIGLSRRLIGCSLGTNRLVDRRRATIMDEDRSEWPQFDSVSRQDLRRIVREWRCANDECEFASENK
ncbi:hypothetical protein PFISCL1PPCAC_5711 [Pristionchus fissidentatus]|uniref:Uncharacterized protein n=1 Tax=Pristionchus fissidentatus TaxID=1538716 RepID=A0AAV5V7F3_9BILA|nr:hypothetical protein PFISCL1PPCAC_5711 [Pristionchus fissidentatus]